jgi:hypothetical protein
MILYDVSSDRVSEGRAAAAEAQTCIETIMLTKPGVRRSSQRPLATAKDSMIRYDCWRVGESGLGRREMLSSGA